MIRISYNIITDRQHVDIFDDKPASVFCNEFFDGVIYEIGIIFCIQKCAEGKKMAHLVVILIKNAAMGYLLAEPA